MKKLFLLLTLPLVVLDQLTKGWIIRHVEPHDLVVIWPNFFYWVQVHNSGAAFGIMKHHNAFFVLFSFIALGFLVFLTYKKIWVDPLLQVSVALLMAGILGNLIDRLTHGFVLDFLLFDLHIPFANPWPAFNVADACISIAAGLLLIAVGFPSWKEKRFPK